MSLDSLDCGVPAIQLRSINIYVIIDYKEMIPINILMWLHIILLPEYQSVVKELFHSLTTILFPFINYKRHFYLTLYTSESQFYFLNLLLSVVLNLLLSVPLTPSQQLRQTFLSHTLFLPERAISATSSKDSALPQIYLHMVLPNIFHNTIYTAAFCIPST